jgi:hypothetical protein
MGLTELAKTIRFDNASKGFDPTEGGVERYLLLAISEICEAQNELRDGHSVTHIYYSTNAGYGDDRTHGDSKPEGFPVEIADAIIRILDIQAKLELEIKPHQGKYSFDVNTQLDIELLSIIGSIVQSRFSFTRTSPVEMAYHLNMALSGLLHVAENCDFDVLTIINEKLAFNRTRPPKHGRKF